MRVIIQPRDGVEPLIEGIGQAKTSVEIIIYRLDRLEIEQALIEAAARGVLVHALITYTNKDDLEEIKRFEKRLTKSCVRVTRTDEKLVRYHCKMMIVDRRRLFLLTFNYTFLDIYHSCAFGVITEDPELVDEAIHLFEVDAEQTKLTRGIGHLIVSPVNARPKLSEFILGAENQLLIYDDKLSDAQMISLLEDRVKAGVDVKVIGKMGRSVKGVEVRKASPIRLHAQAIIRDGNEVFFGSQSLRKVELDRRREVGLITDNRKAVKNFFIIFEMDWGDIVGPAPKS
jgi:phosphatidylserine/phosphatidylglycerophosphate/cardiolipin synthase-like enzyme